MKRQCLLNLIFCCFTSVVRGDEINAHHVFLIDAEDTKLSGFAIKEGRGIITSLHGVVKVHLDGGRILVSNSATQESQLISDVTVEKVDIARDLALLSSPQVEQWSQDFGFRSASSATVGNGQSFVLVGYHGHLVYKERATQIQALAQDPVRPLSTLLGADLIEEFSNRRSPDVSLSVLALHGEMAMGHSGGPLFNANGEVIGVANGGVDVSNTGNCWAIPLDGVNWKPVQEIPRQRLERLAGLNSKLFAVNSPQTRREDTPRRPVPPLIAAEQIWKSVNRLKDHATVPSTEEVLNLLPEFAIPEARDKQERVASEFQEFWPEVQKLHHFPRVLDWRKVNTEELDSRGNERITFQATLEPSPFAFDRFGQVLPPPWVQLLVDMDEDGVPGSFNMKGYTPYGN